MKEKMGDEFIPLASMPAFLFECVHRKIDVVLLKFSIFLMRWLT
jgi:hypothetical protein